MASSSIILKSEERIAIPVLGFLVIFVGNCNKWEFQGKIWEQWGSLTDILPTHKDKFAKMYEHATWIIWGADKGFWRGNNL